MKNYIKVILFIALLVALYFSIHSNENSTVSRLKKNGKWTKSEVVEFSVRNGARWMHFIFFTENGQQIKIYEQCRMNNCNVFLNKKFTVLYNPDNPYEVALFYHRSVFDAYNIPFPDSLKWVDQYEGLF